VSLTALLGTPVTDAQGTCAAVEGCCRGYRSGCGQGGGAGAEDARGLCIVPSEDVMERPPAHSSCARQARWFLWRKKELPLLQQDLMDRQIIDIHGAKWCA